MTGNVDLDRLADYVGGALAGTPDEAEIARLITTDSAWTRAHASLVRADTLVRADLRLLAAEPEPMPDEVLARLAATLEAVPPVHAAAREAELPVHAAAREAEPPVHPAAREADLPVHPATPDDRHRGLSVLPGGRAARVSPPAWRRRAVVGGIAAAVVVLGLGAVSVVSQLRDTGARSSLATSSAGRASAPRSSSGAAAGSYVPADIRASGTDYSPERLSALPAAPFSAQDHHPQQPQAGPDVEEKPPAPTAAATGVPDELRPLTEPAARVACLEAIAARYGGTPTMLDYARFEGRPALIVLLDGAGGGPGRKWAVAVGPGCGAGGTVGDLRYSGPAG